MIAKSCSACAKVQTYRQGTSR